jgi:hypothetical protein
MLENDDDIFNYENVMQSKKRAVSTTSKTSTAVKKAKYKQYGLVSRKYEFDELGPPDEQSGCFGCCYVGEQDSGAAPYEPIMKLMAMIRKSISKTNLVNLAINVARKYEEIRQDVNNNLLPGEKPLPEWKAATILHHIRYHNLDPELQTWVRMSEYQELIKITLDASVVIDEETGELKTDPIQGKMLIMYEKRLEELQKSNPSEKLYYSGGEHFDTNVASEGFISFSGKPLIAQWKSSK